MRTALLHRAHASWSWRLIRPLLLSKSTIRLLQSRARLRGFAADGSVTVVVVNWESARYLAVCLTALRRFSDPRLRIIVVDNGSRDDSRAFLSRQADLRQVLLPVNIGHGPAMDIGFLLADTEYVIALDVDAFPVSDAWVARLITPLKTGAAVSGVRAKGGFVHPCALAMRRERFVRAGHTFRVLRNDAGGPRSWWDTGELITVRERPNVHIIPPTHHIGPYWVGTTWDDVVYHNFYAVRHKRAHGEADDRVLDPVDGVEASGVTAADARRAWSTAIEQYLDLDDATVALLISGTASDRTARSGGHAEPASGA